MKWQPIETAQKDGAVIVLTDGDLVVAGWWDNEDSDEYSWKFVDDGGEQNAFIEKYVTHWMPLPEPPK